MIMDRVRYFVTCKESLEAIEAVFRLRPAGGAAIRSEVFLCNDAPFPGAEL